MLRQQIFNQRISIQSILCITESVEPEQRNCHSLSRPSTRIGYRLPLSHSIEEQPAMKWNLDSLNWNRLILWV